MAPSTARGRQGRIARAVGALRNDAKQRTLDAFVYARGGERGGERTAGSKRARVEPSGESLARRPREASDPIEDDGSEGNQAPEAPRLLTLDGSPHAASIRSGTARAWFLPYPMAGLGEPFRRARAQQAAPLLRSAELGHPRGGLAPPSTSEPRALPPAPGAVSVVAMEPGALGRLIAIGAAPGVVDVRRTRGVLTGASDAAAEAPLLRIPLRPSRSGPPPSDVAWNAWHDEEIAVAVGSHAFVFDLARWEAGAPPTATLVPPPASGRSFGHLTHARFLNHPAQQHGYLFVGATSSGESLSPSLSLSLSLSLPFSLSLSLSLMHSLALEGRYDSWNGIFPSVPCRGSHNAPRN